MGAVGAPIEFWKVKGFAERQTHSAATRGTLPAGPGFIGTLDANRNHRHSGLEDQSQDSDAERLQTPIPGTLAFREDHYRGAVVEATQHGSRGLRIDLVSTYRKAVHAREHVAEDGYGELDALGHRMDHPGDYGSNEKRLEVALMIGDDQARTVCRHV